MNAMVQHFSCLILTLILGIGTFIVFPSSTDVVEAPSLSVPEFMVELVAYPYDVSPTNDTYIDPYTGKVTVNIIDGYHVENESIEIVVTNQPFTSYIDEEGRQLDLYYNVRAKGHFTDRWEELIYASPAGKNNEYCFLSVPAEYPQDGLVDFQVEAIIGYTYVVTSDVLLVPPFVAVKTVTTSGWSNTQTLTVDFENIPEFPSGIILPMFVLITIAVFVSKIRLDKNEKSEKQKENH